MICDIKHEHNPLLRMNVEAVFLDRVCASGERNRVCLSMANRHSLQFREPTDTYSSDDNGSICIESGLDTGSVVVVRTYNLLLKGLQRRRCCCRCYCYGYVCGNMNMYRRDHSEATIFVPCMYVPP